MLSSYPGLTPPGYITVALRACRDDRRKFLTGLGLMEYSSTQIVFAFIDD
jgi:hypothetical protein